MISRDNYPFHACREKDIADVYHVTTKTIRKWVKDGCPKNPDRSYSIYNIHCWLMDREISKYKSVEESGDLGSQKTRKEIELLTARIERQTIDNEELRKNTVTKYLYNRAITTIIESFTKFFVDIIQRNILTLRATHDDELPAAIEELGNQASKHMIQSVRRVEQREDQA